MKKNLLKLYILMNILSTVNAENIQPFQGPFLGIQAGSTEYSIISAIPLISGPTADIFAGYNFRNDKVVWGGEIAGGKFFGTVKSGSKRAGEQFHIKAFFRVGYVFEPDIMIFGKAGIGFASIEKYKPHSRIQVTAYHVPIFLGFGVEKPINDVSLRLTYEFSNSSGLIHSHSLLIGCVYNF